MFEERSPQFDVVAIGLTAMTLFLALALASYDCADPPGSVVWPPVETIHNSCGTAGAHVAHVLLERLGIGAYFAVVSFAVVSVLLFTNRKIDQPVVRTVGWVMMLLGVSTLAAMAMPGWSPGPLVGAGGWVGAMGRSWLEANFAAAGSYLLMTCVLLAGLLLSTDYFVFRAAAVTATASGATLATAGRFSQAATRRLGGGRTDLDGSATENEEEEEDSLADDALADDEEWEYEEEEEADEEDEWEYEDEDGEDDEDEEEEEADTSGVVKAVGIAATAAAVGGLGKRIASALRVKTPDTPEEETAEEPVENIEALPPTAVKKPKTKSEREEIIDQLDAADQRTEFDSDYELPPIDLLLPAEDVSYDRHEKEVRRKARILEKTFQNFGLNVKVVEVETGPVISQYEIELEPGLRLSKITGLADDLAIALRAPSVRIVAPIPGKNSVGIEAPNDTRQIVRLREVIEETQGQSRRMKIPVFLGKDVAGNPMIVDLAALPHLLIAGRTGTGKSVCLNSIIVSILMSRGPDEVRMLMIDPKMVELSGYRKLPHLMHPVVTDMKKAEAILSWAVDKMEERYQLLAKAGVRHVSVFNQLTEAELKDRLDPPNGDTWDDAEWDLIPKQLPFIVIVADEIADLMMTSGKDVEQHIIRLAQKSRAVGIHLILATQKPTVDVITGLIKSNLPARIAFQVASRTDSRVVLDEMGADKLLGNGDMLFLSPGTSLLLRGQGTFLSDDEITNVVDFVGTDDQQFAAELMQLKTTDEEDESVGPAALKNRDELYESAVDVVVRERRGSVSLLQRCLGIGYGRAARLIDFMAEDGIVGEYNGSQAREILITPEEWEVMTSGEAPAESAAPVAPKPAASSAIEIATEETEEPTAPWEDEEEAELETDDKSEEEEEDDETEEADEEEGEEDELADEELADDEEWEYEEEDEAEEEDEEELADDEEWEYEEEDEDEDLAESA